MLSGTRKINTHKLRLVLSLLLFGLIFSGCSFIRIQNVSDAKVRVLVSVPDHRGGYTRTISSGNIVDVFSGHGGRYTVTLLPDADFIRFAETLRTEISQRLFKERASLSADEVATLVQRLDEIDKLLEDQKNISASCGGNVPDFDTVVVTISYDIGSNTWHLACQ